MFFAFSFAFDEAFWLYYTHNNTNKTNDSTIVNFMNGSAIFHAATQCLHCTFYECVFWSRVCTWHKKVNNLILVKVSIYKKNWLHILQIYQCKQSHCAFSKSLQHVQCNPCQRATIKQTIQLKLL